MQRKSSAKQSWKKDEAAIEDDTATKPESPPLSVAFVEGWHSLPTELKLNVLSNIIPTNQTIEYYFLSDPFRKGEESYGFGGNGKYQSRWLWPFFAVPAFSTLALDSLFLNNTFSMRGVSDKVSGYEQYLSLPSTHMRDRVQHLKFSVSATDLGWKIFRFFARGGLGFRNQQTLELDVNGGHGWPLLLDKFYEELERHGVVTVVNAKIVRVTCDGWGLVCWRWFDLQKFKALVETHVVGSEGLKER